jgi:hypothetical protein
LLIPSQCFDKKETALEASRGFEGGFLKLNRARPKRQPLSCFKAYRLASKLAASPKTHFASGVGVTIAVSIRLNAPSVASSERRTVHHGRSDARLLSFGCAYVLFITPQSCPKTATDTRDVYVTTVTNTFQPYSFAERHFPGTFATGKMNQSTLG